VKKMENTSFAAMAVRLPPPRRIIPGYFDVALRDLGLLLAALALARLSQQFSRG